MKKPKIVKEYVFKEMSHADMMDYLNETLPVSLKNNVDLVDRIHSRYPLLDKSQISFVVRAIFQSIRDLLVLGKVLNFNNLFFDTKLHFFDHRRDGHILPALKVKIATPPPLRDT
jgi:hypothetical protein